MSERKPSFWFIKKDGKYYNLAAGMWESDRGYATRYNLPPSNVSGTLVPVYVTVKKIKKGHSWSWACKRLLEGKKVRRAAWLVREYIRIKEIVSSTVSDSTVYYGISEGGVRLGNPVRMDVRLFTATDWELHNE